MMKKTRGKVLAVVLTTTVSGMCSLGCSDTVWREFRDAAINGVAGAIEEATFNWFTGVIPDTADE
ncbi:MAG: hypothetical protein JSU63_06105 [Phycisphaerales bacterium]|nr:MAG: hypothetical protein JSU63_06105 [Phycisphaerales bacterium]